MYQERERIAGKEFQTAVQTKDRLKIPFGIMAVLISHEVMSPLCSNLQNTALNIFIYDNRE